MRHNLKVDSAARGFQVTLPFDNGLAKFMALTIHWPHAAEFLRNTRAIRMEGRADSKPVSLLKLLNELDQAIKLDPNMAVAYKNRGRSYFGLQNYQKAIEDLNTAIEIKPKLGEAYAIRAMVKSAMGDRAGSREDQVAAERLGYKEN